MSNMAVNTDAPPKKPAPRRAIDVADYLRFLFRRFTPAIKRMQCSGVHASTLARPPAADPQRRCRMESFLGNLVP